MRLKFKSKIELKTIRKQQFNLIYNAVITILTLTFIKITGNKKAQNEILSYASRKSSSLN